jgi:3-hydroxyisobutyrate dehydrogenase-like beta-hydroxyacid dehydrogenase
MHEKAAYQRIGLIGAGEMGSGIGGRLASRGVDVRTTLAGRSAASAERIQRAGIGTVEDLAAIARSCALVLSIVPPDQALGVAESFVAAYVPAGTPAVYVDCNAVAPETVAKIAAVITAAGIHFVDAGIIGGPPSDGYEGPKIYASGPHVTAFEVLNAHGLYVKRLDGPVGLASALKMCYGGLTKGITGIGSSMFACAENAGLGAALAAEFSASQPALYAWLTRQIPTMFPKAYRWVGEMREIATFGRDEPGVSAIYDGIADRYAAIALAQTTKGTA